MRTAGLPHCRLPPVPRVRTATLASKLVNELVEAADDK
jgi:hypothetical protein